MLAALQHTDLPGVLPFSTTRGDGGALRKTYTLESYCSGGQKPTRADEFQHGGPQNENPECKVPESGGGVLGVLYADLRLRVIFMLL